MSDRDCSCDGADGIDGSPACSAEPRFFPGPPPCGETWEPDASAATNPKFLFLREIGGGSCLKKFLDSVIKGGDKHPNWGGTLILDEIVTLKDEEPLIIPPNFTLAGVGMHGMGGLRVPNTLTGPAITFAKGGSAVLRDLNIETAVAGLPQPTEIANRPAGIRIEGSGPVYIDAVKVLGLSFGIQAENAIAVHVSNSLFDGNFINIELRRQCRHWRIRDTDIRFGWLWGVNIVSVSGGGSVDTLIHGCLFESNGFIHPLAIPFLPRGAIMTQDCFGTFIFGNRFEGNGPFAAAANCFQVLPASSASEPDPHGVATRFMCNLTAQDQPRPGDFNAPQPSPKPGDNVQAEPLLTQTHIGFNSTVDWGASGFFQDKINAPKA